LEATAKPCAARATRPAPVTDIWLAGANLKPEKNLGGGNGAQITRRANASRSVIDPEICARLAPKTAQGFSFNSHFIMASASARKAWRAASRE